VSCPNTTRPNSTVPMLVGVTQASVSVTCSSGFAIDGGTSTTTSFSYTCAGLSPGASNWTSLSRRCLPVNCPATLLVNTNTSMTLAGVTGNVLSPVCANGFSVDGGTSTTTIQSYTCSGTVPGASAWQPNPTSKFCQGVCMCVRCMLDVRTLHVACLHQLLCLAVCQVCVLFTLLLHLAAAVNCTATNLDFTAGVSRLVGTTATSTSVSCAPGYSIGGGNSTLTTQSYSCLALLAGASSWSPNPAQVRCQGAYATLLLPSFFESAAQLPASRISRISC
jgi:hypothetical protein